MKCLEKCILSLSRMLTFFVLLGCISASQESNVPVTSTESEADSGPGIIHFQFVDEPAFYGTLTTKTNRKMDRFDYVLVLDGWEREGFRFGELAKNRSLAYPTTSERVVVRRYLSFFEFQDLMVQKGDSVIMSFDASKPVVIRRVGSTYAARDLNVEALLNERHPGTSLTAGMADDTRMVAFKYFYDDPGESKRQLVRNGPEKGAYLEELENKMGRDLLPALGKVRSASQQVLDSLRDHHQISEPVFQFYQQKYSNLLLKLAIMAGSLDSAQAARELNRRWEEQRFRDVYFYQCLDAYEKKYFTSRAKWTESNQYHLRDPRESFTLAKNSSLLSNGVKDQMLFGSLQKIDQFFPDKAETYLNVLTRTVTDQSLIQKAEAKYRKDKLLATSPSNLHLLTINREQITIEELLRRKKGKVLYLDFWASWCAPCIEEMPHSKSLFQDYQDKDLEVVFISMDDTYLKWTKAAERLGVNLTMNSFQILAPEKSTFLREHKLKTIPRYMIVDKTGKVVNSDAPRPGDPRTKGLLDALLRQ
jgi:thiol-disulfide isomerase/thioredoxin